MQFITIQNQIGESIAINPKLITQICYDIDKQVLVYLGDEIIYTNFTNIFSAVRYIEQATHDRFLASERSQAVEDLWRSWGDIWNLGNLPWVCNVPGPSGPKTPSITDLFRGIGRGRPPSITTKKKTVEKTTVTRKQTEWSSPTWTLNHT